MSGKKIPTQQNIKQMHLKAIFLEALRCDGVSRAQLKKSLGLSFPSVSALVDELLADGFLCECGTVESTQRGRPVSLLRCVSTAFSVPVAVMTREGYQFSLFDCCGKVLQENFLPYLQKPVDTDQPWQPDADTICIPMEAHLARLRQKHRITDLVICAPGSINAKGRFTSSALQLAAPAEFFPRLEESTGLKVHLINSSDADAYAERLLQPLPEDFIFLHIGRGVGAGIIRKGKIYTGAQLRAGEIGHISVDWQGPVCSCGNRGCLEKYVSLRRIAQDAQQLGFESLDALAQAYDRGDKTAVALLENKAQLLAVGISNMLTMQPVQHIVIGGAVCQFGDDFLWAVRSAVQALGFRKYMNLLTVTYTKNPAGNGAMGAFWNYIDHKLILKKEGINDV